MPADNSLQRTGDHRRRTVPHTHVALDDAVAQGALFCNMLADR